MGFASYHFSITALTLWFLSQPCCGVFGAKSIPVRRNLHLVVLMGTQVILQNLSLAYSSVIFHQLIRILLSPATALLGFVLYRNVIPRASIIPLMISCGGVGIVFYSNSGSTTNTAVTTSSKGVIFASIGVLASALYTALVGRYQKRLQVSSMQLLLNQAPVSAGLLLCMAPFLDEKPSTSSLSPSLCIAVFAVSVLSLQAAHSEERIPDR
jgi:solute carrier family 35 protein E3